MKTLRLGMMALLAIAFLSSQGAIAGVPSKGDTDRIKVSFADLNIQNAAGAKVLYARLQHASEAACKVKPYRTLGAIDRFAKAKQCYDDTLDSFVSRIDSDMLKRLHAS